jgi:CIC family chloride channel protein
LKIKRKEIYNAAMPFFEAEMMESKIRQNLNGRIFAKDWLLPTMLGITVGLAISLLDSFYRILNSAFLLISNLNSLFRILSAIIALCGGYLIVRLLAEDKKSGCGTDLLLERYHWHNGFLSLRDTVGKTLASIVTVGFGGSAGLVGPSLMLGSGISSFITRKLGLDQKDVKKLFLCGAAAGFSAFFRAPLTGILFALELPYKRDIETGAFIPASIASITAYFASAIALGRTGKIFDSVDHSNSPSLLHAVVLGILAALIALVFTKIFEKTSSAVEKLAGRFSMYLAIPGGILLGIIGLFYPEVLGLGCDFVQKIVAARLGEFTLTMLIGLLIFKIVATTITLSFGGSGGLFFPTLYIGGTLGLIYAQALNLEPSGYVMLAMAALLAATSKTLLASVTLVAETIGSNFIIPTLISAALSYFITGNVSFYRKQLLNKSENAANV